MAGISISALGACGASGSATPAAGGTGGSTGFPRTIKHELGETKIPAKPARIASVSVVLTGSLLAIEAPVAASGGSAPNSVGFDDKGFFSHWSAIAKQRKVQSLYTNSQLDLESVAAAKPDLIIMSNTGGDSTKDHYAQLAAIAPTVNVNYNALSWQDVMKLLGEATGLEQNATRSLADYETRLGDLKAKTKAPAEAVQAIVYNNKTGVAVALPGGPHDGVLSALGFKLAPAPTTGVVQSGRKDMVFLSAENAVAALTSKHLLMVDADEATKTAMLKDPAYAKVPAASGGTIVPLGRASFKLDYYSALDMAEHASRGYPG